MLYYEVLELPLQQVENLKEITVCPPTPRPRPLPPPGLSASVCLVPSSLLDHDQGATQ